MHPTPGEHGGVERFRNKTPKSRVQRINGIYVDLNSKLKQGPNVPLEEGVYRARKLAGENG
jgi:hypothetical protein